MDTIRADPPRRKRSPAGWAGWRRGIGYGALVLFLVPVLLVVGVLGYVHLNEDDLPDIEPFIRFELPTTGVVVDSRGEVLIEVALEYRSPLAHGDLPPILLQAILATEDRGFLSHGGVAYRSLPRVVRTSVASSVATWWAGDEGFRLRFPQGGSTITQQLVRGYFLQDRTRTEDGQESFSGGIGAWGLSKLLGVPATNKLLRKLEEVRLALWLEREMERRYGSRDRAKHEILSRYATLLYMGNGRYGYAAASEYYFDRPLSSFTELDAGKAALLAGIGKSPHHYAPVPGNPEPVRRRNEILALMAGNGFILDEMAERARSEPVVVAGRPSVKTDAPAVINQVLTEMAAHGGDRFGVEDLFVGRVSVRTTVDLRLQAIVNEALETGLALYEARHPGTEGVIQGSVVVLRNRDGAILAVAGGREIYGDVPRVYSDFNRATESLRQPGSAWKPIVYLAAFRAGLALDTEVVDAPTLAGTGAQASWISNYDGRFVGPITLRQALAESRNTVAVRLAQAVGLEEMGRVARELGITTPIPLFPSAALGASEVRLVELAGAYRALASGVRAAPHVIHEVTRPSGEVLYRASGAATRLPGNGLREIQEGLRGVVRIPGGTANALNRRDFPIPVMGKTGTTNSYRDALFVGSTYGLDGITVAVRVGFDDNRSMGSRETGGRSALPIFREIMTRAYGDGLVGPVPAFPPEFDASIARHRLRSMEVPVLPLAVPRGISQPLRPLTVQPGTGARPR